MPDPDLVASLLTRVVDPEVPLAVEDYRSEMLRELAAEHERRGEVRGKARSLVRAVLTVLEARGVAVPPPVREQILACTHLAQLDTWLRRATTATTADEVIRG